MNAPPSSAAQPGKFRKERIRLTQEQLDEVVKRHEVYQSGRLGGRRALLAWTDLSKLNLAGRDLRDADLTGCWLMESNLEGARLDTAILYAATSPAPT